MFFTIIVQPFWSASTDAMARQDQMWIRRAVQKLLLIWLLVLTGIIIMVLLSSTVYKIWLKGELLVPMKLTIWMAIFTAVQTLSAVFVNFINGSGKIFVQMVYGIIGTVINLPISYLLVTKLHFGPEAIVVSLVLYQFIGFLLLFVQYRKISKGLTNSIWGW
jgi:O-antigen/teichoic acid export membrane protein